MKTVKTSWKQIRRTPYQALAAVFIMILTFLSISVFFFIVFGSSVIINHFESLPRVSAFFKEEAKQEEIDQLQKSLRDTGKISKMQFISKEEAVKIYKNQNKDDPLLLEFVTEDTLPRSLEVSTYKIEDLSSVANVLQNSPTVETVKYYKDVVAGLSAWTNGIKIIGFALITFLLIESIFIMMNVVGSKVSQKREEIEIMQLLSATNWYIRTPFMIEGIIYGVIGAILGWLIATAGLLSATPSLELFLKGIPVLPASPIFLLGLLAAEFVIAIFLGVLGSYIAVLRYLK